MTTQSTRAAALTSILPVALVAWLRDAGRIQASLRRIQGAAQNTRSVTLPLAEARQAVVSTFIKDGFNITQAHSDLVTATRTIKESKDEELSYVVSATAAIAASGDGHTLVALSVDQQTVLHRATHDWFHLLWVVPLFPYATEYQTVVRSESTVDDPKFYGSFFSELDRVAASVKAESGAEFPDALQTLACASGISHTMNATWHACARSSRLQRRQVQGPPPRLPPELARTTARSGQGLEPV